jgi:hypothetical protein
MPPDAEAAEPAMTTRTAALVLTAALIMGACGDPAGPSPARLGSAEITVEMPGDLRSITGGEAAFYVYGNGPDPWNRAMYLVLGLGERGETIEVEVFQFLEDDARAPAAGTFATGYGPLWGEPSMGGQVLLWKGFTLVQLFAERTRSTVTLDDVTDARVRGRFSMVVESHAVPHLREIVVRGSFEAARVETFEELPRRITRHRR